GPKPLMPTRSWPAWAESSAAMRAAISRCGMWSMVALTPFDAPQSRTNWSIHLSYPGTKWLHCTIFSSLSAALASRTKINGPAPTDERAVIPAPTQADLRNLRRDARRLEETCLVTFETALPMSATPPRCGLLRRRSLQQRV